MFRFLWPSKLYYEVDNLAKMQLKFPLISSSRSSAFEQTSDKDSNSWCASFQIKSSLDFILDAIMAYSLSNHKVRGVFIHWTAEAEWKLRSKTVLSRSRKPYCLPELAISSLLISPVLDLRYPAGDKRLIMELRPTILWLMSRITISLPRYL